VCASGCGKSGPPLPPIVRTPAAPGEFTAARRGNTVELRFNVPAANTDGTRPANVERVDIYAYTGSADLDDRRLVRVATQVAHVAVKRPRDPNQTIEPEEPASDMEPTVGAGLDQGEKAVVREAITAAVLTPLDAAARKPEAAAAAGPLLPPVPRDVTRTYVSVPVSRSGRRGPFSPRVSVPLAPPPPPPVDPEVSYTETTITVKWSAPPGLSTIAPKAQDDQEDTLPAKPIWSQPPQLAYHVYDVSPPSDDEQKPDKTVETRLTSDATHEPTYADSRITWGAERCYAIRAVETIDGSPVESDPVRTDCVTLEDTFPPAPPKELKSVAGEGVINLIWQPNSEKDLAGYIVLRGASADTLQPVVSTPIKETTFPDKVTPGMRYVYAIKAVDKAGNASAVSNTVEETAR
jgi:hypothetical protein